MNMIGKFLKHLFDEDIDLKNRLLSAILTCVMLGSIIGLVPMLMGTVTGWWWLNIVILVAAAVCQVLNLKFGLKDLASTVMAIVGVAFVIPLMYFTQGGFMSGVPFWMIFSIQIAFIMMSGRKRYVTVTACLVVFSSCMLCEYSHPELVIPLPSRAAMFIDIFTSFLAMTIIFLVLLWLHMRAFDRERKMLNHALQYDALTGVENRYAFENYIQKINAAGLTDNLMIVSADVNGLKVVNDTNGHTAGDEMLVGAAEIFTKTFGSFGYVYRTGGDEFQAILRTDRSVEELNELFEKNMADWSGEIVKEIHISVGYACNRDLKAESCAVLIQAADKNMYKAKAEWYRKNGKNRRRSDS